MSDLKTIIPAGVIAATGAGIGLYFLLKRSKSASSSNNLEERSTTSSAGGGVAAYETRKAVDEYLQFHFGADDDILPYASGPKEALHFPARCALLCEKYCEAAADFTGEQGDTVALDVGCAVGGATFELARAFTHVLGIDYSHMFVEAALAMQRSGRAQYQAVIEADIRRTFTAEIPEDIDRNRVKFMQGDACDLPADLAQFDAVLAANLLCRLPEPVKFLQRLPSLVKPGGVAVLVSPYSWLSAWTDKAKWLGGFYRDGTPVPTADTVASIMGEHFELVAEQDMPFLIREHARKFQWGCSHGTVWRRKK